MRCYNAQEDVNFCFNRTDNSPNILQCFIVALPIALILSIVFVLLG
jgi:hypothetical protein